MPCPMELWTAIVTEPRIIAVHTKTVFAHDLRRNLALAYDGRKSVPSADVILDIYCSDIVLGQRLRDIYIEDSNKGVFQGGPRNNGWG